MIAGVPALTLAAALLAALAQEPARESQEPPPPAQGEGYGATPPELVPYHASTEPYRRLFDTRLSYRGPGRYLPEPEGLSAVRLGLLAPLEGTAVDQLEGRALRRGIELRLEEANAQGGLDGLPYELVVRNDAALWGSSANTLVELAMDHGVWAVFGSIDGNSTHVALRVALKIEVLMVTVGSTDPTVTETGIPWIVRCTPDSRQTCYRLAQAIFEEAGLQRVALIRSSDRYGRFGVKEFRDAARRLRNPLPMEVLFHPGQEDFGPQLERVAGMDVDALVVWSRAEDAARLIRQARAMGLDQPVYGPDRLSSAQFVRAAGPAAEGVYAVSWLDPDDRAPAWAGFRERYLARYGEEPDAFAAYAYDAATLVVEGLGRTGLNRARLRDDLMDLRQFRGVAGPMRFDETSNNVASPILMQVRGGRLVRP